MFRHKKTTDKVVAAILLLIFTFQPVITVFAQEDIHGSNDVYTESAPVPETEVASDRTETTLEESKPAEEAEETVQDAEEPTEETEEIAPKQSAIAKSASSTAQNTNQVFPEKPTVPQSDLLSGALVYSYPIYTPAGRNGLTPSLSLKYNSQDLKNSSIFGYGWDISIPYIQRLNKHGTDQLYTGTYNDFYSSEDGDLVQISGSLYSAKTENGAFNKYDFSNNIWTVTAKDGTVYKYSLASSYKWMLTSVTDSNGNTITYTYFTDQGQVYPDTINYADIYQVKFLRTSRADQSISYKYAFLEKTAYIISNIQILVNGAVSYDYVLTYSNNSTTGRSRLASITLKAGSSTMPATTFGYQTESAKGFDIVEASSMGLDTSDSILRKGLSSADVNGDGYSDFVKAYEWTYSSYSSNKYVSIFNTTTGKWQQSSSLQVPSGIIFYTNNPYTAHYIDAFPVDINGDLKADLIAGSDSGTRTPDQEINTGAGWTKTDNWKTNISTNGGSKHSGDINGDGLTDYWGSSGVGYWTVNGNIGYQWDDYVSYNTGSTFNNTYQRCFSSDSISATTPSCPPFNNGLYMPVDINGDGLTDLVKSTEYSSNNWDKKIYLNTGAGWALDTNYTFPNVAYYSGNAFQPVYFSDVNNDGYVDIVTPGGVSQSGQASSMNVYINNGKTWVLDADWYNWGISGAGQDQQILPLDIDANNSPDFLNYANRISKNKNTNQVDLLSLVTLPAGGQISVTYKPSTQYKDASGNLLNPYLPLVVQTVNTITTTDPVNNVSGKTTYEYSGGTYYYNNAFDRKFAGFERISATDAQGNVTKTYFHTATTSDSANGEYLDNYYKIGKVYRTEKYNSSGALYQTNVNKWDSVDLGSSRAFVKLAETAQLNYDGGSTHKDLAESYVYDNNTGNQTEKISWGEVVAGSSGSFSDTGNDKYTTDTTYAQGSILSAPSSVVVYNYTGSKAKESKFYYDSLDFGTVNKGNLTKEEDWISGSSYASTQKEYNSFGLVTKTIDPNNNASTCLYDAANLYCATATNALGQAVQYVYDYATGKPTQITDTNGNIFRTAYDGFGRVTKIEQPDQTAPVTLVTKTAYAYTDTPGAVSVQQIDYLDSFSAVTSYAYYDGLGRKIQVKKSAENGNFATQDFVYDNLGNLQKESLPYFSFSTSKTSATSLPQLYGAYLYDALGRKTSVVNAVGTTSYVYSGWQTTTTDVNGNKKDYISDAFGNLIKVNEYNGLEVYSTNYLYNTLGNLLSITDALGNIRSFTYDSLGRRLTAQGWSYVYDNAGNLVGSTDPKGQVVGYAYDALNRKTSEDYAGAEGVEKTFTYDSCVNGKGLLCDSTSASLTQKYEYSALGNVVKDTKTIASKDFVTQYSYDRQGNQTKIINPDSSEVKYEYNTAGLVERVVGVASNFDYSPTGQIVSAVYANGTQTTNTYDADKLYRLARKVSTGGGANLQDISYQYDNIGNITQTTDNSSTSSKKTVVYTYDNLYRLTSSTATNTANSKDYTQTFTYDALGNLLTQTNNAKATTYSYSDSANPDAVTKTVTTGVVQLPVISYFKASPEAILSGQSTVLSWNILGGTADSVTIDNSIGSVAGLNYKIVSPTATTNYTITAANSAGSVTKSVTVTIAAAKTTAKVLGSTVSAAKAETISEPRQLAYVGPIVLVKPIISALRVSASSITQGRSVTISWTLTGGKATVAQINNGVGSVLGKTSVTVKPTKSTTYTLLAANSKGTATKSITVIVTVVPPVISSFTASPTQITQGQTATLSWTLSGGTPTGVSINNGVGSVLNKTSVTVSPTQNTTYTITATNTKGSVTKLVLVKVSASAPAITSFTAAPTEIQPGESATLSWALSGGVAEGVIIDNNVGNVIGKTSTTVTPQETTTYVLKVSNATSTVIQPVTVKVKNTATPGTTNYQYDANGNLTSDGTNTYSYDYNNRLIKAITPTATITYTYDQSGQRIMLSDGTTTTIYPTKFYNTDGTTVKKHIYAGNLLLATIEDVDSSSNTYYHLADYLNSTNITTNSTGETVETTDYYAFGDTRLSQQAENSDFTEQRKFIGQEYDTTTGLNYLNARYYNATLAKFTAQDPLALFTPEKLLQDPQQLNLYSYARNNPIIASDPSGLEASLLEMAYMVEQAYFSEAKCMFGGWDFQKRIVGADEMQIDVYSRSNGSDNAEYSLVNRGTRESNNSDLRNNILQVFGQSTDLKTTVAESIKFVNDHPNSDIAFGGHSKGGPEAEAGAIMTGKNAILFNPAPLSMTTDLKGAAQNYNGNIQEYIVRGEPINMTLNNFARPLNSNDNIIYLPSQNNLSWSQIRSDGLISSLWNNAKNNHNMSSVIKGIKDR